VFYTNDITPYVMRFNDKLSIIVSAGEVTQSISISHPDTPSEANLLKMFQSLYVDKATTSHSP
jgi:hypothetical protein